MILRRVQVEGFRCFRSRIELSELSAGTNLIYAPNETGKSSLVLAIARALFDRYGAKSEEMLALRPWGTQLSPKITLELETKGRRYRLDKSFLDGAMSRLSEWTGERFEPLAEANAADEIARGFLCGVASAKGASDLEHWGLARLLWMTQAGRLAPPKVDSGLRERLLQTLGAASLGEQEQKILSAIDDAFECFYTPRSEQLKKAGPLAEAQRERDEALADVEFWRRQSEEAAVHTASARAAETQLDAIARRRETIEKEIAECEVRAKKEAETEATLHEKRQEWKTINERWKHCHSALEDLKRLKERIDKHRAEAARLEAVLASESTTVTLRREAAERAAEEFRVASERVSTLTASTSTATLQAQLKTVRGLREIVDKAQAIKVVGEAKRKEYNSRRQPKADELAEIRKLHAELERARMRLDVCGVEVGFEAEGAPRRVSWSVTGETRDVAPGERVSFRGSEGILKLPGVGTISVRSGAEDVKKTAAQVAQLQAALGTRLETFGVRSVDELSELREKAALLENEISLQISLFTSTLTDRFRNLDEARRTLTEAETQLREHAAKLGLDEEGVGALPSVDINAITQELRGAKTAADAADRKRRESETQLAGAVKGLAELTARKESETKSAEALSAEWEAKIKASGTIEQLAASEREEALQQMLAERQVKALEAELPPPGARASVRLQQLRAAQQSAAVEEREAQARYFSAKSLLDKAAGEGVYTKLNEAEERLVLAEKVLSARRLRALASKHLRALAKERHERLNDSFVQPIQEVVGRYFGEIRGRDSGLALGSSLDRVSLATGADFDSELAAHSFGTQEQAMFVIRLALGRLLAERGEGAEPQMIVLDDPLVNTDEARRARALELIRRSSEKLQILILTAFPEKYRGLGGKEFDLSTLRHGNA